MSTLVLSGTGPSFDLDTYFRGSLFDRHSVERLQRNYFRHLGRRVTLEDLQVEDASGQQVPLLRPLAKDEVPHLTTATLDSIMRDTGTEAEMFDLAHVWNGDREPDTQRPTAVLLSTSFIINQRQLSQALSWITDRYQAPIVLGGQYSNIKFAEILRNHSEVTAVIRGDGEITVGPLMEALAGDRAWSDVPNVAKLHNGALKIGPLQYGDMAAMASPSYLGEHKCVPYESMRGCPFSCKFCSFPAASPKFRWKSAEQIANDWRRYADMNGASSIRALDSIFTVPPRRLRELMEILSNEPGPVWEGFSRANTVKNSEYVDMLVEGRCSQLAIGYESMSDDVLGFMDKRVSADQNRRANELLHGSAVGSRGHFMVGYPGETPAHFAETDQYLRQRYAGEFKLSIFSFTDETMPVWQDADRFQIEVDPKFPEYGWSHIGMSAREAHTLHENTIRDTRWDSDEAVWLFWQRDFQTPLIPGNERWADLYIQKLVERLAFLPLDMPEPGLGKRWLDATLWQLQMQGITLGSPVRSSAATVADRS